LAEVTDVTSSNDEEERTRIANLPFFRPEPEVQSSSDDGTQNSQVRVGFLVPLNVRLTFKKKWHFIF
jgi:hypothetical protein